MPIYEYRCANCAKLESLFLRSFGETASPVCSRCGSTELRKLVSRFYSPRSEEARLDALADPSAFAGVDENDPRSIARWARRLAAETGEDLGDDFREMVDMMEAGQMPDDEGPGDAGDEGFGEGPGDAGFGGPDLGDEAAEAETASAIDPEA